MKFATAVYPRQKLSQATSLFIYGLVGVMIVLVVVQLITVEKFLPIIESYQLPNSVVTAKVVVACMFVSGVLSVPFLLRMRLSPLFRLLGAVMLITYSSLWVYLSVWAITTTPPMIGNGLLGGIFVHNLPHELFLIKTLMLLFCSLLAVLLLKDDLMASSSRKSKKKS